MLQLCVVILNYRTPALVIECLQSLVGQVDGQRRRVVVVDNCSADGSSDQIAQAIEAHQWDPWVELLRSPVNGGFAAGNNLGIRHLPAEHYLLLNSDTVVRPQALDRLMGAATAHPRAGLVSPRLEWPDGQPQISCFRPHSPWSEIIDAAATGPVTRWLRRHDVPLPVSDQPVDDVPWTSFACVLVRQQVFEQVGLLDDGFFMYYEDVDFCRRARQRGWRIHHSPDARVVHLRGGSGDVKASQQQKRRPPRYFYASRSRYFRRAYGPLGPLWANLGWLCGRAVSKLRELAGRRPVQACQNQWRDIWIDALPGRS